MLAFLLSRIHSMVIDRFLSSGDALTMEREKKERRQRVTTLREDSDQPEINKHPHDLHGQFKNGKYGKYKPDAWNKPNKDDHQ